jgi:hypothetical protein
MFPLISSINSAAAAAAAAAAVSCIIQQAAHQSKPTNPIPWLLQQVVYI